MRTIYSKCVQNWSNSIVAPFDHARGAQDFTQVLLADAAVGLRAGTDRDLRVSAVRQGNAGSDDRELHVALVPV